VKYNALPILDLIDRYFIRLNDEIKWGYNLPYMLSGLLETHPNYAKALTDRKELTADDMVKVLETVKSMKTIGYSKDALDKVLQSGLKKPVEGQETEAATARAVAKMARKEKPAYKDRHKGRDFLILAGGATLKEYKAEIDEFIRKNDPVVMGGNFLGGLFKPDYHGFSNRKRFMTYIDQAAPESKLLLSNSFEKKFVRDYTDRPFEPIVHLNLLSSHFDIKDGIITSNCRSIALLLVASAIVMGARRIFIAGMDGYKSEENFRAHKVHFYDEEVEAKDFRMLLELHNWNEMLLGSINDYLAAHGKDGLYIITPTSHKQFYKSIYNWKVDVVREPLPQGKRIANVKP
jgi:4-hydroxy 2-oxovalerate aldolase